MGVSAEGEKGKKKKRKQLRRGINAWMMHWVDDLLEWEVAERDPY